MIYWTASNNSSYLGYRRSSKSMTAAVRDARSYLRGELYGEGTISYFDEDPTDQEAYPVFPVRTDEKSIFTNHKWKVVTEF